MEYEDRVYGKCEIAQPVVLELMSCATLRRLKGIDQAGYGPFWAKEAGVENFEHSRFSHSVGVCLLLSKYGATLEEQIAGLIHDVSHTAFSHCTEYVFNAGSEEKQSYQDSTFDSFVKGSEIPHILMKYGFDPEYILDDGNFPLKEKSLPDLCADRIDYVLRDAMVFSEIDEAGARYFLDNLAVEGRVWYFGTCESAKKFAELFFRMNNAYYAGFASARMFAAVADFVTYIVEKGYVSKEDLKRDDEYVVGKAKPHLDKDEKLNLLFERMENKIGATKDADNFGRELVCKSRAVDPLFLDEGKFRRVSGIDPRWKEVLAEESKPKRYFVKFER